MNDGTINRRKLLQVSATALLSTQIPRSFAHSGNQDNPALASSALQILYQSTYNCNAVAITADEKNTFLAFPRFGGKEPEYSVARLISSGHVEPFPNNDWNRRGSQSDPLSSFVAINTLHIFSDNTLWVVDQGSVSPSLPVPGAQKIVQLDTITGDVLKVLRFSEDILPKGAQLNDLRIHGRYIFFTDSGLGAIVIHDQQTGHTIRRLSQQPIMTNDPAHPVRGTGGRLLLNAEGQPPRTHSNQIEVDPAGTWLYFAPLVGPLRKVKISDLLDTRLDDAELAKRVEITFPIPSTNGTAMDSRGNLFVSDAEHNRILVISPEGEQEVLVADPRLISADALFIDHSRNLYIPCAQVQYTAGNNRGHTDFHLPFYTFKLALPRRIGEITLGDALG